jgi:NTP pyrophosphatase (non-canonical NTP hydrolase)
MAIAAEAAELMEHFLWLDAKGADEHINTEREEVENEVVDIAWMVLCFCNRYNIDLSEALERKAKQNAVKYPIEKAKGNHKKYTKL